MRATLIAFGVIEVEGQRYDHDVVIDRGRVAKRHKGPSKALRAEYGHTPLTAAEAIPWGGKHLIVGTGQDGQLPVAPDVLAEARERGVTVTAVPTAEACE
ncbi:MAG TPA: MTH938/NDUFAF3 family protein, partial [Candidatus Limnocylindrales bacterium]